MHSSLVRIQNVFGFFTTVVFSVGVLIALSVIVTPQTPKANLSMRNVQVVKGRPYYYSSKKEEYAHIKFDLEADLTSLFSWNTKQVFVYVTATFPSKHPLDPVSEAIIWDAIIPASSAPWHYNTYIHPTTAKSSSSSSSGAASSSKKSKEKNKDKNKPYPPGAEPGILRLHNQKPKYQITTPWSKIGGYENCTLHLRYNIQPWVGALTWSSPHDRLAGSWKAIDAADSQSFDMPRIKPAAGTGAAADPKAARKLKDELKVEVGAEGNRGKPA